MSKDCWKSEARTGANSVAVYLRTRAGIWSRPQALSSLIDSSWL